MKTGLEPMTFGLWFQRSNQTELFHFKKLKKKQFYNKKDIKELGLQKKILKIKLKYLK